MWFYLRPGGEFILFHTKKKMCRAKLFAFTWWVCECVRGKIYWLFCFPLTFRHVESGLFFQLKIKIYEDKKREVRVEKRQAQNK